MTGEWFDAAVAALARARSRRAWGVAAAAAALGIILGDAVPAHAGQATVALSCRGKQERRRRNAQCCSGRCRKRKGNKKGKCRCSRYLEPCRKSSDCCASAAPTPLVCASGTCQT